MLTPNHSSYLNENGNPEKNGINDTRDLRDISILSWNINGIGDKLGEIDIHNFLKEHDVIVLLETMKGKLYNVYIPGYVTCHFARPLRHKIRKEGGFLVLIKQKLKECATVSQTNEYVVWLIFSGKSALSHVGFVHIPPNYSTAHKSTDPFDELQNEIEIKRTTGKVVISGDFNARTAELRDTIGNIDLNHYTIRKNSRENDDKTVNSYGGKLIDSCKNNNMIILN